MKRNSVVRSVAVGLVFTAGGHQLMLDPTGGAHAAQPMEQSPVVAGQGECSTEPASGCIQYLYPAHPGDAEIYTTRHSGQSFGIETGHSDGASGFVWLHAGSPMS